MSKSVQKALVILAVTALAGFGLFLNQPKQVVKKDGAEISFLNVGQGDATLVKTPNEHYVLIDGGPDKKVLSELGEVLPPTARSLDTVVLSHPHADHVAGLNYVLDRYQVGGVYLSGVVYNSPDYLDFLNRIKEQNIPSHKTYVGQDFEDDGVSFRFLYPKTDLVGQTFKDQNDSSNVIDISYQGQHVLMLGDFSAKLQEKNLNKDNLASLYGILKVSHHGSKTGTSSSLLTFINPKFSVISVGKDNSFGHPAALTLGQLAGSVIKRTDQNGRLQFLLNSSGVTLE